MLRAIVTYGAVLCLGVLGMLSTGCQADADTATATMDAETRALLQQADVAMNRNDYRRALVLADSAIGRSPELAAPHFLQGLVYSALNRFEPAQAAFMTVLEKDPAYPGAWFQLGHVAFQQGQYQDALGYYEKEQALIENASASRQKQYAHVDASAHPAVWLQMGRAHKLMNEYAAAREAYERALALDSLQADGHAWLAELDEEAGDFESALAHAQQALALDEKNPDYQYRVGLLLTKLGKIRQAGPHLEAAVMMRPWHEGSNYNFGRVLMQLGEEEDAQAFLARADTLQKLQAEIAQAKAAAYQQPDVQHHWTSLAALMLRTGQFDEARQAFGAALMLNPTDLAVHNDMANLALAAGDTVEALRRYEAILEWDPSQADVWLNLGVLYAMSRQYDEARRSWEQALHHQPDHSEARLFLRRLEQVQ